jgi:hypothetical protein
MLIEIMIFGVKFNLENMDGILDQISFSKEMADEKEFAWSTQNPDAIGWFTNSNCNGRVVCLCVWVLRRRGCCSSAGRTRS